MESKFTKSDIQEKYSQVLRTAKETESIASATCEELKIQTDTINRISDKNYEISDNLDKSERLVKGMSGFFGRVKNFFTKSKKTEVKPPSLPPANAPQQSQSVPSYSNHSSGAPKSAEDEFIDQLSHSANNLKSMASCISDTLDEHNKKLDKINDLTAKNTSRVETLNYKAKKLMQ